MNSNIVKINTKQWVTILLTTITLNKCSQNDELLLAVKEIQTGLKHQISTQNKIQRNEEQLKRIPTQQGKLEYLKEVDKENQEVLQILRKRILEDLYKLREINNKGFTGKNFKNIRATLLKEPEEGASSLQQLLRFIAIIFTSSKYDSDIELFQLYASNIADNKIIIEEIESFPRQVPDYIKKAIVKAAATIDCGTELNSKCIEQDIEKIKDRIKFVEKYR